MLVCIYRDIKTENVKHGVKTLSLFTASSKD